MRIPAYAKINLFLDVVGVRDDGFHAIKSIMHAVTLCDYVSAEKREPCGKSISVTCRDSEVPEGKTNLVYRAAEEFFSHFGIDQYSVDFVIEKNIPVAAGLAGGSSDAAAALKLLSELYGIDKKALYPVAEKIGSDVPFCLMGGTCVTEGRGEILTPLACDAEYDFVICKAGEGVSTPAAYKAIDLKFGDDVNKCHGHIEKSVSAVSANDPNAVAESLYNIFEEVVLPAHEQARTIRSILLENGALGALLSGSGPSVFGIFKNCRDAVNAAEVLESRGFVPHVCRSALKG